jgi:hypothetical protein
MKTISVTVVGRKEFLTQFIKCLKNVNKKEEYTLYVAIEPTSHEIYDLVDSIDFMDKKVIRNDKKLGVSKNPYTLLSNIFDDGSKHNIYLEEDLIFSRDITDLSEWMIDNFNDRDYSHFSMYIHCLSSKWKCPDIKYIRERHDSVFSPLGFTLTQYQWNTHFKPHWHINKNGWDFSILQYIKSQGFKNIEPYVSRTKHIGHYGTNCVFESKQAHDDIYSVNYYDGPKPEYYTLNDEPIVQLQ